MSHVKNPQILGTLVAWATWPSGIFGTHGLQCRCIHGSNYQHHKSYFY